MKVGVLLFKLPTSGQKQTFMLVTKWSLVNKQVKWNMKRNESIEFKHLISKAVVLLLRQCKQSLCRVGNEGAVVKAIFTTRYAKNAQSRISVNKVHVFFVKTFVVKYCDFWEDSPHSSIFIDYLNRVYGVYISIL